jgi:hypothetical protein
MTEAALRPEWHHLAIAGYDVQVHNIGLSVVPEDLIAFANLVIYSLSADSCRACCACLTSRCSQYSAPMLIVLTCGMICVPLHCRVSASALGASCSAARVRVAECSLCQRVRLQFAGSSPHHTGPSALQRAIKPSSRSRRTFGVK